MKTRFAALAAATVVLMTIVAFASTSFTYATGSANPFWKSGNSVDRDVNCTITCPAGTTVTVCGKRDGSDVDTQRAGGVHGNLNYTFDDVDEIAVVFSSGSTVTGSARATGSGTLTSSTYNATTSDQVLFSRAARVTVGFLITVTSGSDVATVQAWDGEVLVGEWQARNGDPLNVTVDCKSIKVLSGSGEGTFDRSIVE